MHGVLPILPDRGLNQSIVLAVLIGLYVLLFFTEVFGWVWVGLVVPGYLASVFVIQPVAGVAITVESVATFAIARFDTLARSGAFSPFFGRERFFLIILVSVLVRQQSQIWVLPALARLSALHLGTDPYLEYDLASIGLVVVPLTANAMWKLDVPRGLFQVGLPVLLVYLALRLVLLPYTNLSYSSLELTYENVALDFLASPKAYVILLVGGYLAARFNLRFGWDYNGILVPALLGLAWFYPLRLVSTAIEAILLVYLSKAVVSLPMLRTKNLEGPRKIVLVFTTGFFVKYAVAWVVSDRLESIRLTDLFGFGYLISSLLAVKMLQKKVIGRVILPSLVVSAVAWVVGSGVGFALDRVLPASPLVAPVESPAAPSLRLLRSAEGTATLARLRLRALEGREAPTAGGRDAAGEWTRLWDTADAWLAGADEQAERLRGHAERLGLVLTPLPAALAGRAAFVLHEREERLARQRGWDTAVLVPGAPGPVLLVPAAQAEAPAADVAIALCRALSCRAVLVRGLAGAGKAGEVEPHGLAMRHLRRAPLVAVRVDPRAPAGRARLHVLGALPAGLELGSRWPLALELSWSPSPLPALGADERVVTLRLTGEDAWALVLAGVPLPRASTARLGELVVAGEPAPARAPAPSETELLALEELARLLPAAAGADEPVSARRLVYLAVLLDHRVQQAAADPDGTSAWIADGRAAGLGVVVARAPRAGRPPLALAVPRPYAEPGTLRLAVELWEPLAAEALVVGAGELEADDAAFADRLTPFFAYTVGLARELAPRPDSLLAQVRGFSPARALTDGLVVGVGAPVLPGVRLPAVVLDLIAPAGALAVLAGAVPRIADGAVAHIGLDGADDAVAGYAIARRAPIPLLLWFSPAVRSGFLARLGSEDQRFADARVALDDGDVLDAALALPGGGQAARLPALVDAARGFAERQNPHALAELARATAQAGGRLHGVRDRVRGRVYLVIDAGPGRSLVLLGDAAPGDDLHATGSDQLGRALLARRRVVWVEAAAP